jgi:hypothetical protein
MPPNVTRRISIVGASRGWIGASIRIEAEKGNDRRRISFVRIQRIEVASPLAANCRAQQDTEDIGKRCSRCPDKDLAQAS